MSGQVLVSVFALAPLLTAAVAVAAWRHRRDNPAAWALTLALVGISGWSIAVGLVQADLPGDVRAAAIPLIFLSVGPCVAGFWAVSRLIARPERRLGRRRVALLCVEPVSMAVLSVLPWTSDLVFGRTDLDAPVGEVVVVGGAVFAAHSLYSYAFVVAALVRLCRTALSGPRVVRRQAGVLVLAATPPVVGNGIVTVAMNGAGAVDLTPLFFIATGLLSGWAILRMGLLAIVPVARDQVVETMTDGVLVSDAAGRLVDLNPAARRLLARLRPDLGDSVLGEPLGDLVGPQRVADVLPDGPAADGSYGQGRAVLEVVPGWWLDVQTLPVADRGRRVGRLTVVRDVSEDQRREADLRRLNDQLAEQVRTIDRLRAILAEEAVRDPLTGLHNRRHLDRALASALRDSAAEGRPVAVLAVDIDHFKAVNDTHGHAAGDRVLDAVAGRLRAAVRAGDTVARVGGEEFVVVLPGTTEEEAVLRAEGIRASCALARHPVPGGTVTVTVSSGVAVAPPGAGPDGAAELLAAADRALYRAKADGRDRVVAAVAPTRPSRRLGRPSTR